MTRIDWAPVDDNSSSIDAIAEFSRGASIRESLGMVWDPRVKRILRKLGRMGVSKGRARARAWYRRNFN